MKIRIKILRIKLQVQCIFIQFEIRTGKFKELSFKRAKRPPHNNLYRFFGWEWGSQMFWVVKIFQIVLKIKI